MPVKRQLSRLVDVTGGPRERNTIVEDILARTNIASIILLAANKRKDPKLIW
jgi:hypothetical protein